MTLATVITSTSFKQIQNMFPPSKHTIHPYHTRQPPAAANPAIVSCSSYRSRCRFREYPWDNGKSWR